MEIIFAFAACLFLAVLFVAPVFIPEPQAILGIDGNYSVRFARDRSIDVGMPGWWRPYWLGLYEQFGIHTFMPFYRVFEPGVALPAIAVFSWLMAMFFTYLLLRRLGVGFAPALFGGIGFGLTPHFATLLFPCHLTVISAGAYVAMLFYFLTRVTDRTCSHTDRGISALFAGAAWGMLMNESPQRGLYFSVLAAGFLLLSAWLTSPKGAGTLSRRLRAAYGPLFWGLTTLCGLTLLGVFAFQLHSEIRKQSRGDTEAKAEVASEDRSQAKWEFSTSWSHHPAELVDAFASGYHGEISGDRETPYIGHKPVSHNSDALGLVMLTFAIVGVLTGIRRNRWILFFSVAALLAVLLAMGGFMPGRPLFWLWYQLPMMSQFRAPVKFMSVAAFALAILSAFGLEAVLNDLRTEEARLLRRMRWALAAAFGIGLLWYLTAIAGEADFLATMTQRFARNAELGARAVQGRTHSLAWLSGGLALLSGVAFCSYHYRRRAWTGYAVGAVCIGLMAADLFRIDTLYLRRSLFNAQAFYQMDNLSQFLTANKGKGRAVMSLKVQHEGRTIPLATAAARGHFVTYLAPYHDLELMENTPQRTQPKDYAGFFSALLPPAPQGQRETGALVRELVDGQLRLWQMSYVRYLVTDGYLYGLGNPAPIMDILNAHPALKLLGGFDGPGGSKYGVFEFAGTLPSLMFYPTWTEVGTQSEAFKAIAEPSFDPSSTLVLSGHNVPPAPAIVGEDTRASLKVLRYSPGQVEAQVTTPAAGVVVLSRRYTANWHVFVDDQRQETLRAQGILTGVPVEAGIHYIKWTFAPSSPMRTLSLVTIAFVLIVAVVTIAVLVRRASNQRLVSSEPSSE